ncbi:MAG: hypothetical protein WDO24_09285 [Pseudomonadota bacterium]
MPVLFVVEKPGAAVDQEALLAHCRQHLSAYKISARGARDRGDPPHRLGEDHALQAARTAGGGLMRAASTGARRPKAKTSPKHSSADTALQTIRAAGDALRRDAAHLAAL